MMFWYATILRVNAEICPARLKPNLNRRWIIEQDAIFCCCTYFFTSSKSGSRWKVTFIGIIFLLFCDDKWIERMLNISLFFYKEWYGRKRQFVSLGNLTRNSFEKILWKLRLYSIAIHFFTCLYIQIFYYLKAEYE